MSCPSSCPHVKISRNQARLGVRLYRLLPWLHISRLFGQIADAHLPPPLAALLVWLYAWAFACNLTEAELPSVWSYSSLGAFFRRKLAPAVRPLSHSSRVLVPADGTLTSRSPYSGGGLTQIKGVHYCLATFLGRAPPVLTGKATCLYQAVIYLCPGDYHGFHSPAQWTVKERRHIWGELLSVAPPLLKHVQGLFALNERVVLEGKWAFGYFAMVAVGATNVGSIRLAWEPGLATTASHSPTGCERRRLAPPLKLSPGEQVGQFGFGSSIVLVFEAPEGLQFPTKEMETVKYGQHLL